MAQQRVTAGILLAFTILSLVACFLPDEVALHFALEPFKYAPPRDCRCVVAHHGTPACSTLLGEHAVWNIITHALFELNVIAVR